MDQFMLRTLLAIFASLLVGCAARHDASSFSSDYPTAIDNRSRATNNTPQTSEEPEKPVTRRVISPSDPPVMFRPTVNLSIYHLRIPLGAVSGSDEFWKRVDEHAVDVSTYDVLIDALPEFITAGNGADGDAQVIDGEVARS